MTTGGFGVARDALAAHVAEVDALADRAGRAAEAARPLQRQAYGLIGQVFADAADAASRTAVRSVADLAEAVRRHGDGVRIAHDMYVAVDEATAARLRELR